MKKIPKFDSSPTPTKAQRTRRPDAAVAAPLRVVQEPVTTEMAQDPAPSALEECLALLRALPDSGAIARDDDQPLPPREPTGAVRRGLVDSLASIILADLDGKQGGRS